MTPIFLLSGNNHHHWVLNGKKTPPHLKPLENNLHGSDLEKNKTKKTCTDRNAKTSVQNKVIQLTNMLCLTLVYTYTV